MQKEVFEPGFTLASFYCFGSGYLITNFKLDKKILKGHQLLQYSHNVCAYYGAFYTTDTYPADSE